MTNPLTEAKKALDEAEFKHDIFCLMYRPIDLQDNPRQRAMEANIASLRQRYHQLLNDEDEK